MKRILLFAICIVFSLAISVRSIAQTSIFGTINKYSLIDSVYPTKDTLKVVDASDFNDGDTVMIYQPKGATVDIFATGSNKHHLGSVRTSGDMNNAGRYEIIIVQKVLSGNRIRLRTSLDKQYDYDQKIQIIRVPSYKSASIDATLTCKAWDGEAGTGGVLALMVSDTLFMNANIDVSGKGFRGALPYSSDGTCYNTDSALYTNYNFTLSEDVSAGLKGEGITEFDTTYRRGFGKWATGGGGGNGRFAGGGGGGNSGFGGFGGHEDTTFCHTTIWDVDGDDLGQGGLGGHRGFGCYSLPDDVLNDSSFLLGGGGGSGTSFGTYTASVGGNGGGIVILMVRNLKANGFSINTEGADVGIEVTASGAGGGAGGTIGFDVDNLIGEATLSCAGGAGGRVESQGESGPGGGGGGGAIHYKYTKPDSVIADRSGGIQGYYNDEEGQGYGASAGEDGEFRNNYRVPLTGFLFNYVLDNQTICEGIEPDILLGSIPRGGDGTFVYKWEKSNDNTTWVDAEGNNDTIDYQPPALTDTIFYRRVVNSLDIADTSYSVKIEVQESIKSNLISGNDLIICINNESDSLTGTTVKIGGEGAPFKYDWQLLEKGVGLWESKLATKDTVFYPGTINDTTYVRRIVSSGACYDTTLNIEIIGLPQISNNTIDAEQEICFNEFPDIIEGSIISGGDGIDTSYQWQKSTDNLVWNDIPGAVDIDYLHSEKLTDTTYFKRIVYSDDCEDESNVHTVIVLPSIIKDAINPSTLFHNCYGTQTDIINGSEPEGGRGSGSYIYTWKQSLDNLNWDLADGVNNEINYQSVPLTSNIYFRRHVQSGACKDSTDALEIKILLLPIVTIADFEDTICSGEEVILDFTISLGAPPYSLVYNDGDDNYTENILNAGLTNIAINPITNLTNHVFDYTVFSVIDDSACVATDMTGLTKIIAYGNPNSNAGLSEEFCSLEYTLKAVKSLGSGLWTQISENGSTNIANITLPNSEIVVDEAGEYTYKWKETNWHCVDSAEVNLTLYQPVTELNAGSDTSLFFVDKYELKGDYKNPDDIAEVETFWEIIQGYGTIENSFDIVTNVTDLVDDLKEGIIVLWTVTKGGDVCEIQTDSVVITLQEIFTPTGFTPNGDGYNDELKFNGLENAAGYDIIIFNRWGTEVFSWEGNSDDLEWDGRDDDGKDLPDDTYYYILNVENKNGTLDSHKGFIVIKRD